MKSENMQKVCVITPVYDSARYLPRCLDSLLSQTFRGFSLLLIDDGSTDGSAAICDAYAAKDERVTVIHQRNMGQAMARNAGIDIAMNGNAEYITFVDSDDTVDRRFLEALLSAVSDDVKIVSCFFNEIRGGTVPDASDWKTAVVSAEDYYCNAPMLPFVIWGKIYHRSCFEELRFPNVRRHEDTKLVYLLLFQNDKLAVVSEPMYRYYVNDNGVTRAKWTPDRLVELEAMDEQLAYFKERGLDKAYSTCAKIEARMLEYQLSELGKEHREYRAMLEKKLRQHLKTHNLKRSGIWPR